MATNKRQSKYLVSREAYEDYPAGVDFPPLHPHDRERGPVNPLHKPGIRSAVWDKTAGRCWYCGVQTNPWRDFAVDHFIARATGGSDDLGNLVPCCRSCNNRKGERPIERLRQILSEIIVPSFTQEQRTFLTAHGIALPTIPASYVFYFERLEGRAGE